ncbi:hypothetical protein [Nonomuraea salmonea]|uniref:DUF418 domain-containing protein n=1 Tax=Nonomuraea salmonea TaxID=46181 RepID=A0ABV5NE07_9ACTN
MTASAVDLAPPDAYTDEDCPGISPHPAVPRPGCTALRWIGQGLGPGRVVAYTCSCQMTAYGLVSCVGIYQFHRRTLPRLGVPPVSWTAEWWRRGEAHEWWRRLLAGQAR